MPTFSLTPRQRAATDLLAGPQTHTCIVGGSRSGKTFTEVRAIVLRALSAPGSRHAILRLRFNAVRASIALDTLPKVMKLCFPGAAMTEHRQDGYFSLDDVGSQIWIGGLDEKERVEKILGQEYATMFFNECSQLPYASVVVALTRLAQNCVKSDGRPLQPKAYYDLNPTGKGHWTNRLFGEKRAPGSLTPVADPDNYARLFMNPGDNLANLPAGYLNTLATLPERHRKRFLDGVYIDEADGALWSLDNIEATRNGGLCIHADNGIDYVLPVSLRKRIVVAVDASGAKDRDDEGSDEIGIVVMALGQDDHGYVLADYSMRGSPAEWGKIAVNAYKEFKADRIVAEQNFGGEMVRFVIRTADPNVPCKVVTASRGKEVRAEPVSVLYEQKRIHHVGRFPTLEDQMCAFTTGGYIGEGSPDHADALVWAATELMVGDTTTGMLDFYVTQAAKLAAQRLGENEASPVNKPPPIGSPAVGGVRLLAPAGVSNVYGIRGRSYNVEADGTVIVEPDDVRPLIPQGFTQL